jgi:hypothetical protein
LAGPWKASLDQVVRWKILNLDVKVFDLQIPPRLPARQEVPARGSVAGEERTPAGQEVFLTKDDGIASGDR